MFEFGFKSDTGKMRKVNQDSFFVIPDKGIFLIADGVGGHNHGEIASRTAISDVAEYMKENPVPAGAGDNEIKDYFVDLIFRVNEHIFELSEDASARNMATTLILMFINNGKVYAANIGDSRLYLLREGGMEQVTEDHTYVNDLYKKGVIDEEQARVHPDRNLITRAVGAESTVKPDLYMFEVFNQDILLLCTDGLYDLVEEEEIRIILTESDNLRTACSRLVEAANEHGGTDNITTVAVRIETGGRSA